MNSLLPPTIAERLIPSRDGCWLWTGPDNGRGYGVVSIEGRNRYVHRIVYELVVGEIPAGFQIDHLCRVRQCANPAHLEAVTPAENVRRTKSEHCPHGHQLFGGNLYIDPRGARQCRACRREALRRLRRRRQAAGKAA